MSETVDLVLTDPPYNTRRELGQDNTAHDLLTKQNIIDMTDECDKVLARGGQVIIFCSFMQFPEWVTAFKGITEDVDVEQEQNQGEVNTTSEVVFSVEQTPLKFTRARGFYNCHPKRRNVTHVSMTEIAVHAWKRGPSHADIISRVDYSSPAFVPTSLPGWTDTINNIPRLAKQEAVFYPQTSTAGKGKPKMVRPEQKSIAWIKTLVNKYCPRGGIVFDPFAGTLSTAKACISLAQHRKCICGDIDNDCLQLSMPSLVEVFAEQILSDNSDISGTSEVQDAAATYLRLTRSARSIDLSMNWTAPPGLSPMQYLPPHILHFVSGIYLDYSLYRTYQRVAYRKWVSSWRQRFNELDSKHLLAHELGVLGLELRESTIPGAGMGIFTNHEIGDKEVVGHFYGALIYDNLGIGKNKDSSEMIGEGVMSVPVNEFSKWAVQVDHKAKINNSNDPADATDVWVYPFPFCAMRYINDGRRPTTDDTQGDLANPAPDRNNVNWSIPRKTPTNVGFQDPALITIVANRNIPTNSELFVDYGDSFNKFT
jgi:DNA modification methylase